MASADHLLREAIADALRGAGYLVATVEALEWTVAHVARGAPGLLILDLEGDLSRAAHYVRAIRGTQPGLPVLAVVPPVGADWRVDVDWASLGADAVLLKPFGRQQLLERVRRFCRP